MKEYYYCMDGQTVEGPYSELEIKGLWNEGTLKSQTLVCPAGEKEWLQISSIQFSVGKEVEIERQSPDQTSAGECTTVDHQAIASAGNDKDDLVEEDEDKGHGKYQLIRSIRADLDLLWKAQRESIISQLRGLELDAEYETTRKQAKLIKERVKEAAQLYWKKTRAYDRWIADLVWNDCDIQRKLRGNGCAEKHEDAVEWLTKAKLINEAGCYCFKKGKDYLYIGKAGMSKDTNLGSRLKDHRRAVYFEQSTHLRIIIPRHKTWISKLERLLLLNYPHPIYNEATPTTGNNPADSLIDLLETEMNELLTDG